MPLRLRKRLSEKKKYFQNVLSHFSGKKSHEIQIVLTCEVVEKLRPACLAALTDNRENMIDFGIEFVTQKYHRNF